MISVTVFLIREFAIASSAFRQPFYVFIFIFTVSFNIAVSISAVAYSGLLSADGEVVFYLIVLRYYTLVVGAWNTAVCFNRVTAIVFPLKYSKMWTRTSTSFLIFAFLAYPFAFQIPFLLNDCWFSMLTKSCVEYQVLHMYIVAVSVIVNALLGMFLIIIALGIARYNGKMASQALEIKLILQTLATSIMLLCVGVTKMISMQKFYEGNMSLHQLLALIGSIFLALYSHVVIGGLFLAR
uniref:Serpentine receptor class gamma n=1 Tax=Panagrellus redivivus TaxID=6233 RepID=A0A7E4W5I3_PANRE